MKELKVKMCSSLKTNNTVERQKIWVDLNKNWT